MEEEEDSRAKTDAVWSEQLRSTLAEEQRQVNGLRDQLDGMFFQKFSRTVSFGNR